MIMADGNIIDHVEKRVHFGIMRSASCAAGRSGERYRKVTFPASGGKRNRTLQESRKERRESLRRMPAKPHTTGGSRRIQESGQTELPTSIAPTPWSAGPGSTAKKEWTA